MANNAHELDLDEGAFQSSGDKTIERSPVSGTKGIRMNLLTRLCLLCRDGSRFRRRLLLKGPTSQRWKRVVTFFNSRVLSLRGIAERRQSDAAWRVREMNVCLTQSEWKNVQEVVLRDNNCSTIYNVVAEHAEENELDTWQEQLRRSGDHDGGNRERATKPTEVRSCRA